MSRRGATTLRGVLVVDKPAGMTSHDVVACVRRATGEGRVGHAGTLDPMATGVLVVLLGSYARLAAYLTAATKAYDATISFGAETDTDDAEGTITRSADVAPELMDAACARRVLDGLLGHSEQVPPAYSAIKVGGTTAHRAARSGDPLELAARPIEVLEARLISVDAAARTWDVAFTVSKGTYIRSLARDIGRACGSAAHLSALRRTASGSLTLHDTHTLEEIAAAGPEVGPLLADPVHALGLPVVEAAGASVLVGAAIPLPGGLDLPQGSAVAVTVDGRLAAVYRAAGSGLVPAAVLLTGGAQ